MPDDKRAEVLPGPRAAGGLDEAILGQLRHTEEVTESLARGILDLANKLEGRFKGDPEASHWHEVARDYRDIRVSTEEIQELQWRLARLKKTIEDFFGVVDDDVLF